MEIALFVGIVLAGLLAGSELTSWAMVHPTLWKLDHRPQVRAEKLMYRRFATVDPFLMTGAVIAAFVAAGTQPAYRPRQLGLCPGRRSPP